MRLIGHAALLAALVTSALHGAPQLKELSPADVEHWSWHLVPLPRQIDMTQSVVLAPSEVALEVPNGAPVLLTQAARELREALGGTEPTPDAAGFRLTLRIDAADQELASLQNRDQAYRIAPAPGGAGLLLIGGGERGAYYAAKTMQQFITARRNGGASAGTKNTSRAPVPHDEAKVQIPLVRITDWPDLEVRGLWGSDSATQVRWMSDRKMNYDEQISYTGVDREKRADVRLAGAKQRMIDEGPAVAVEPVPVILHLEQVARDGFFDAFPNLKARGGKPGSICYSDGGFTDVLADWLVAWREKPGVRSVDVWMAENMAGQTGCQCEKCAKENRSVLEARTIVAAYRKAKAKQPDLRLYVLTSEETERSNPQVFAELPREVRIWYYHSLFTYNSSESPMIRPYLVDFIKQGRWIGVCPNLCAGVGFNEPFTGPQFMHARLNEFVDKGLSGIMGYATPRICACMFNVEAAAEWGWNAKGRSPREFSYAWAVRRGLKDPETFAEWTETLGPVSWDVYGSEWPMGQKRKRPGRIATLLKEGNLPELGTSISEGAFRIPWYDIKSPEQLEKDVAGAERAVELARRMGNESFLQESLAVQGYIYSLKALWELKQIVRGGAVAESDRPAARKWFKMYIDGLAQADKAVRAWEASVEECDGRHYGSRGGPLLPGMIEEMKVVAADLGCAP